MEGGLQLKMTAKGVCVRRCMLLVGYSVCLSSSLHRWRGVPQVSGDQAKDMKQG